jgi:hypothetical protein
MTIGGLQKTKQAHQSDYGEDGNEPLLTPANDPDPPQIE